jgi:hypothetical protein
MNKLTLVIILLITVTVSASLQVPIQYTGTIGVCVIDTDNESSADESLFLRTNVGEVFNVTFDERLSVPLTGSYITGYAIELENQLLKFYNYTSLSVTDLDLSSQQRSQRSVGVFYMNLQGNLCSFPGPGYPCRWSRSFSDVQDIFYNDPVTNLVDFYHEISDGNLQLLINETSVFDVNITTEITDLYGSFDNAILDSIGVRVGDYDHAVFMMPYNWYRIWPFTRFSVAGVAETPGRRSWINGRQDGTIFHELGHNFGLGHANARFGDGSWREYGDQSSVMGNPRDNIKIGINSLHRYISGWLSNSSVITTSTTGVWEITRLNEITEDTPRVVIFSPDNLTDNGPFFIEFRERISYDSELGTTRFNTKPSGDYYNTLLVRKLEIIKGYRQDTLLLAIIEEGEKFVLEEKYDIHHTTLKTVNITDHIPEEPQDSSGSKLKTFWLMITVLVVLASIL